MARLTTDTMMRIKNFMDANEWTTKAKICNAVGVDMITVQYYFNAVGTITRLNGRNVKEFKLLANDRASNGPPVEEYRRVDKSFVRAGGLDFKKIKSRGIG